MSCGLWVAVASAWSSLRRVVGYCLYRVVGFVYYR